MPKNPHLNAILAAAYIVVVASIMSNGERIFGQGEETIIIPIAMISLFTLSAAMMGYFFAYHPIQLYLDGQKKEATQFFGKTVLTFAVFTVLMFLGLLVF